MQRIRSTFKHSYCPSMLYGIRNGWLGGPYRKDTRLDTRQLRRIGGNRGFLENKSGSAQQTHGRRQTLCW